MANKPAIVLYIAAVTLIASALLALALPGLESSALPMVGFLALLCAAAQGMPVSLFASSSVSVAVAFSLTAMLLYGPAAAILVNVPGSLVHSVYPQRRPLPKALLNFALASVAAGLAGYTYRGLGGQVPVWSYAASALPLGVAVLTYYAVQSLGVALAIRLAEGGSLPGIWGRNYRWLLLNYLALGGISLGMALAYRSIGVGGLLIFSLPLVMAWHSFKMYTAKRREAEAQSASLLEAEGTLRGVIRNAVHGLASLVDERGTYGLNHSEIAMRLAAETALNLGLDEATAATAQLAAVVHDVGTLGIPESILLKRGPLTREEMEIVQQHPRRGAELLRQIADLEDVANAVLYHHERFDGKGYPAGLIGPEIPIAAQIVGVVEAYQALTAERPYRTALSHRRAIDQVWQDAGTRFNPAVVEAFVAACEDMHARREEARRAVITSLTAAAAQRRQGAGLSGRMGKPAAQGAETSPL